MMRFLLLPLLSLFWTGFVFHRGIHLLSPAENSKLARVTLRSTVGIAVLFTMLGWLVHLVAWVPLVGVAAWIGYALVWLGVFALHYGLGWTRALGMAFIQMLGSLLFHVAVSMLWPVG
jgi:hypothetical protein